MMCVGNVMLLLIKNLVKPSRVVRKQTTLEGKIAKDKPYFDSDEDVSFETNTDEDVDEEDEVE
ncbi:hypothetical protein H5410_045024 [Solanum commersonii]|uniref:Uncharacterized protein n=1 Tax=Solanum commersonii TaxID=4109 RepID=A0A9J5XBF6_SOLCO|nr:hypothetical protein H5410_045024 [Solanum commersonii]